MSAAGRLGTASWLDAWQAPAGPAGLVLPDGCVDVIARGDQLFVVGPMSKARLGTLATAPLHGLRFAPGRVRAWLGESPADLRDAVLDARDFTALRDCASLSDVRRVLLRDAGPLPIAVLRAARALDAPRPPRLAQVARDLGVSERHLRRVFTTEIGLSPRLFVRVRRFHRAVGALRAAGAARGAGVSLAGIAADAGYADQAHFTRDAQALAGTTPARLACGAV